MTAGAGDPRVREATPGEVTDVMSILDAAMLDVSADRVRSLIGSDGGGPAEARAVLLAVDDGRALGALVLEGRAVEAVAVRPGRRGQGIGTALIEAANERVEGALIASFDADLRPFYERLGFEVDPAGEGRFRGRLGEGNGR